MATTSGPPPLVLMFKSAAKDVPLPEGGVNCTEIVQVWACVSDTVPLRQVLCGGEATYGSTEYSAAPVPVIVGAVKVAAVLPSLVTVTDSIFVAGGVTVLKANDPVTFISVPIPLTVSTRDVSFASPV